MKKELKIRNSIVEGHLSTEKIAASIAAHQHQNQNGGHSIILG